MSLLSVQNLRVWFHTRNGIIKAVNDVSFELDSGQILGIVGESGSGKSVSCHSLVGLLPMPPARIEKGSAVFDGIELLRAPESTMRRIRGNRIAMIFQDPMTSLNPYLTIGTQLMEPLRIHQRLSRRAARDQAVEALLEVGIPEPHRRLGSYPHEFSGGMRQRVMIAMALATEPDILIADEPTTALDVTIQAQILDLIRALQETHHIATIYISHDLGVVADLADEVLVMHNGDVVERGRTSGVFRNPVHAYTRKLLDSIPHSAKPTDPLPVETEADRNFLTIDRIRVEFPLRTATLFRREGMHFTAVDGISLTVAKGEILGLVGESGSGKSTVARAVVRLVELADGEITLQGRTISSLEGSQLYAARPDFQMIFQDPYASLNPRMTVYDCLAEAVRHRGRVPSNRIREQVISLMEDVGLNAEYIRKYPHEFSGGQRQRIAVARALAMQPSLIIADEPVSALDVTVQAQILKLLLEINRKYSMTMIFISHDLSVVRYISDRTAVMYQGLIVEVNDTEEVFNHPQHPYTQTLLSATVARPRRDLEAAVTAT